MEKIIVRVTEAAEMLATSPNRVKELIREGQLAAFRDGKNWSIPVECVHDYAKVRALKEAAERKRQWQKKLLGV